jgi:hypothetical protein
MRFTIRLSSFVILLAASACDARSPSVGAQSAADAPQAVQPTAEPAPQPVDSQAAAAPIDTIVLRREVELPVPAAGTLPPLGAPAPTVLRGIYLNAYAAGTTNRLRQLLALADRTEINAFVVDVKDEKGVHYRTGVTLAGELAQPGEITIRNLKALADTLHAHGIHAIARIVVFKDPILSKARPEWSIRTPDDALWIDKAGNSWVSSWEPAVWKYNIDIAAEVVEAGFDEVQFDYVRFPEAYASLPDQVHPKENGTRTDAIVSFLRLAVQRIHPLGGIVAADVFGLSPNDAGDVRIGQQWEPILATADHVLPMVYPSHYFPTHLRNVPRPNRMPYETVFTSLGIGEIRREQLRDAGVPTARVIPWLQAFTATWVDRDFDYGPQQAADQIRAVHDVGLEDWVFWHPGSRYEHIADAFQAETRSQAKPFDPPGWLSDMAALVDRAGAAAARQRVVDARKGDGGRQ